VTNPLLVLGLAGLFVAVLQIAGLMLGRHIRRSHDEEYFPPAVLRPVLCQEKDDVR
jgi:hypothetical protein